MPTSYTSLLGLALPVSGELTGTWGDIVNAYITQYVDSAVEGTQTISGSQTAVTLSTTNGTPLSQAGSGATGSAQYAIINCTGNPASTLTITAPASSRKYIIINSTSTNQSVKIVAAGPTTGVTIGASQKAMVAWNGSDFVQIGGGGGLSYVAKSANYTAQNNEGVLTNTSGGAFTVTLPASPLVGAQVVVADSNSTWGTNNLTVGRNGSTIAGLAENLTCDIAGASVQLVYDGTTWNVFAQVGGNGGTAVTIDGVQTLTNKTINGSNNTITNISLSTAVTGTLPTANGGTGLTGFTAGNNAIYSTSSSALTAGTLPVLAGGTGSTTASGARTNLGATTAGGNFFTLTNPSAITFPRINADNTVSALDAATFRTAIGAGTGGGTVTSVGGTGTVNGLTLSGTVTSSGNLTLGGAISGVPNSATTATNLNTASAIVARDASGNFSAGTITATLSGNATNVTGTVAVANGGTGATSLTANNVLLGNGTSALQVVAPGTSGNVLTSNGTTWTSATPAGGGSWVMISSVSASNSATVSFTSGITSTYAMYAVVMSAVIPVSDDSNFAMQFSSDGGSSYVTTNYGYSGLRTQSTGVGTLTAIGQADNGSRLQLNGDSRTVLSSSTYGGFNCVLYLANPSANKTPSCTWDSWWANSGNSQVNIRCAGGTLTTMTVNALQFFFGSSNISSGRFTLYGIKHT